MVRLLALISLVLTTNVSADTPARHVLRWTRAPGAEACIDPQALRNAVDARLGRPVFTDTEQRAVSIEGNVRPTQHGWHVAITVHGPDQEPLGQRELEESAPDCRVLDEALVLMIALIVDPDAAMRDPQQAPPPPPPVPTPTPAPTPTPLPTEPWRVAVSANVSGGAALLPGATLGGALRVSIDAPVLPAIAFRVSLWPTDEQRRGDQGAEFLLLTGGAAICPRVWRLGLCGGVELGRMSGDGFGFDRSQQSAAFVTYITAEPHLAVTLTDRLDLEASIGAWIPLVRPRFVFEQAGEDIDLYQPAAVAFVGQLGLTLHF